LKTPTLNAPRISSRIDPSQYSRAGGAFPDTSGLEQGLRLAASTAHFVAQENERNQNTLKTERDKVNRFKTMTNFQQFEGNVKVRQQQMRTQVLYDQQNVSDTLMEDFENEAGRFTAGLDPEMLAEMGPRIEELRQTTKLNSDQFEFNHHTLYYSTDLDKSQAITKNLLGADPSIENLIKYKTQMFDAIDRSGLSDIDKQAKKSVAEQELATIVYGKEYQKNGSLGLGTGKVERGSAGDVALNIANKMGGEAHRDQIALDLLTLISYETIGTFSTGIIGGKNNLYQGLIQFGPEERAKYGVTGNETFEQQMDKVYQFMVDRGFKPGMGLLDMYSIVNSGSPGNYNASDRPGSTVTTHVRDMLNSQHRAKARAILDGKIDIEALDKSPHFNSVPYENRVAAKNDAFRMAMAENQAKEKQRSDAYTSDFNTLLVNLNDGKAGEVELDYFREVNPGMSFDDINKAQTVIDNLNKEGAVLVSAQRKMAAGSTWDHTDTEDKKMANALFDNSGGRARLDAGDQSYVANDIAPFVQQSGMIPSSTAGHLQGMIRSNDAQKATFALDALSQLRDQNQRAFNDLPKELNADLDLWTVAKGYMNREELLNLMRGAPSAEQRQAQTVLREEARRKLTVATDPEHVSFDKVIGSFSNWSDVFRTNPNVLGTPDAKVMMRAEFNGLFEAEYVRYGNVEGATQAALKQMSRIWGVSGVGGARYIMKYPPESQYRSVFGDHSWIEKQARTELNIPAEDKMILVADGQTQAEVNKNKFVAGGQGDRQNRPEVPFTPASYAVVVMREGEPPRAVIAEGGKPQRIFFQVPEEVKKAETDFFNYTNQAKMDAMFERDLYKTARERSGANLVPTLTDEEQEAIVNRRARLKGMKDRAASAGAPIPGDGSQDAFLRLPFEEYRDMKAGGAPRFRPVQ
jgi:hypothetical protein